VNNPSSPNNSATPQQSELRWWEDCECIARHPHILNEFAKAVEREGVVGETQAAKLIYLIISSRFLPRIVSASVKGTSSSGKSHVLQQVLTFFPKTAFYLSVNEEGRGVFIITPSSIPPFTHKLLQTQVQFRNLF